MAERELNSADKRLAKTIQKRVGAALRNMRTGGWWRRRRAGAGCCCGGSVDPPKVGAGFLFKGHGRDLSPTTSCLGKGVTIALTRALAGEIVHLGGLGQALDRGHHCPPVAGSRLSTYPHPSLRGANHAIGRWVLPWVPCVNPSRLRGQSPRQRTKRPHRWRRGSSAKLA